MSEALPQPCENTDRELWREREGDYYADSIHVTKEGRIGINCGGHVFVMSLKDWHFRAKAFTEYQRFQALLRDFKDMLEASHR